MQRFTFYNSNKICIPYLLSDTLCPVTRKLSDFFYFLIVHQLNFRTYFFRKIRIFEDLNAKLFNP